MIRYKNNKTLKTVVYCEFRTVKGRSLAGHRMASSGLVLQFIICMLIYNTQRTKKPSKHLNGECICMLISKDTHVLPFNNYKLMHSDIQPNNDENATALIKLSTRTQFHCIKENWQKWALSTTPEEPAGACLEIMIVLAEHTVCAFTGKL